MFTLAEKPLKVLQIFRSSINFWRLNYLKLFLAVLITVLVGSLPAFIVPTMPVLTREMLLGFVEKYWLIIVCYSITMFFLYSFVVHRIYSLMYQTHKTTLQSFLTALKKIPYIASALVLYDFSIFLGFLAFIVPGFVIIILLSMYFIVITVEDKNPISGYKTSWLMVTDFWWHAFWVQLLLMIIIFAVDGIVGALASNIWIIAHPLGQGHLILGTRIIRIAVDLITFPFFVSTQMMLYHDLKLRNKNTDES